MILLFLLLYLSYTPHMFQKKAHILLIQFRQIAITAELELASIGRELGSGITINVQSALESEVDWTKPREILARYDGVIFGGSGDFDFDGSREQHDPARLMSYILVERLRSLIQYIFDFNVPTLGICYGHQLLGAFSGVIIKHDETQRKTRSHTVRLLADSSNTFLCSNLPKNFKAQYGHKDVLERVPDSATLLIEGGDECQVSALCYSDVIFSTQFHPELNLEDMQKRVEATPGYLPEGVSVEEVFEDSPDANIILKNFGELVVRHCNESKEVK